MIERLHIRGMRRTGSRVREFLFERSRLELGVLGLTFCLTASAIGVYFFSRRACVPQLVPFMQDLSEGDAIFREFVGDSREGPRHIGKGGRDFRIPELRMATYQCKKKDTLWSIARRTGLPIDTLISVNNLEDPNEIYEGTPVIIPNLPVLKHVVGAGETLSSISQRYDVAVRDLIEVNSLSDTTIHQGDVLYVYNGRYTDRQRAFALKMIFRCPARGRLTSGFGPRRDPFTGRRRTFHKGIDIANSVGTPVYAALDGKVVYAGNRNVLGKMIRIRHRGGYTTVYAHLYKIKVRRGQKVKKGDLIGTIGKSGRVTGPHVHFEIRYRDKPVDPLTFVRRPSR